MVSAQICHDYIFINYTRIFLWNNVSNQVRFCSSQGYRAFVQIFIGLGLEILNSVPGALEEWWECIISTLHVKCYMRRESGSYPFCSSKLLGGRNSSTHGLYLDFE